ncbi:DNA polymerase [Spirulina sp. 06S082]|uniref:DNA polymerase n=1 Tax=Spirulina sp. 06S082 TaxID=3110248 RepID=UPI002B21619F|nr:DNA polymerase [Spirulina sp. 06S082]MEA5468292.1 DNA polymerase [Spirulina sp. 06S082]
MGLIVRGCGRNLRPPFKSPVSACGGQENTQPLKQEAPPGKVLIKADYSQIELRIMAKASGDRRMMDAYRRGEDLHRLTAALVLGKAVEALYGEGGGVFYSSDSGGGGDSSSGELGGVI